MQTRIFLVAGGLGFIGKHFVRHCLDNGHFVINVDVVNYAADHVAKEEFSSHPDYRFVHSDIVKLEYLPECDYIVNFAAESHVDNSISDNTKFCFSNMMGVQRLLELARAKQEHERPRIVQISTDEVYGDLVNGSHREEDLLRPSNPYSATKAAADMLVQSWGRTYGLSWNVARPSNNYGQHQYPEKLIPKSCARMKRGLPALMHGDGSYVRQWLHVEDTVDAILTIIDRGEPNTIYNVGGPIELQNIEVLRKIARLLGVSDNEAWRSIEDRSGQDVRYSVDDSRLRALGWTPTRDFDAELQRIVEDFDFNRFA